MKNILIAPRFDSFGDVERIYSSVSFTNILSNLGVQPFLATYPNRTLKKAELRDIVEKHLENVAAVLLQGGNDIDPSIYGQENTHSEDIKTFRDMYEIELVNQAVERGVKLLGICRGMQLINVALGGSLSQAINSNRVLHMSKSSKDPDSLHKVKVEKGGQLYKLLGKEEISIVSVHHQSIIKMGEGLDLEAIAPDGVIEAISSESFRIIGVQWHPELQPRSHVTRKLFEWLVDGE
jgi:putative glutamine amidotransferase